MQLLLKRERTEFSDTLDRMNEEYVDRSDDARTLATGPLRASMAEMDRRSGADADARSQRQLALQAMMFNLVNEGAQFIIAPHSPMLLAFPIARICSFDEPSISEVAWEDTVHMRLTRDQFSCCRGFSPLDTSRAAIVRCA